MADMNMDLHDSPQPVALLKVNQTLRQMREGDRLEIRGADPSTFQALLRLFPEGRFTIDEARMLPEGYRIRLTCKTTEHPVFDPADTGPPH